MIARVQHLMRDLALLEELRKLLGFLDARGAHQDRLLALAAFQHLLEHGVELLALGPVDLVVPVLAHDRYVGRHLDHFEPVGLAELGRLGHRRAGHARELRKQSEIILIGDRGQRLILGLDLDVFLGLERLVQALGVAPALHHAARELVDDDDFVVLHDVVFVAREQLVRAQRLVHVVNQRDIVDVVERARGQQLRLLQQGLDALDA